MFLKLKSSIILTILIQKVSNNVDDLINIFLKIDPD